MFDRRSFSDVFAFDFVSIFAKNKFQKMVQKQFFKYNCRMSKTITKANEMGFWK